MLHIKYDHYHVQVSHDCLATRQLWKIDWWLGLYFTVARQQGTHLIHVFKDNVLKYRIYVTILG